MVEMYTPEYQKSAEKCIYVPIPETFTHEDHYSRDQYIDSLYMSHAQVGILMNTIEDYAKTDPAKKLFPCKRYTEHSPSKILQEREEWLKKSIDGWKKQDAQLERYIKHGIRYTIKQFPAGTWGIETDYAQLREHNIKRQEDFCNTNCNRKFHCNSRSISAETCDMYDELVKYTNS